MAAPNGDLKTETAESFARDYLEDLFNNNKNLGAFEEETLDLNIKSKYDDIEVEEESNLHTDSNAAQFAVQSSPEVSNTVADPLEPGNNSFQVNGHADSVQVEVTSRNGDLENGVVEPGQSEFTAQVSEPEFTSQVIEPGQSEFTAQVSEPEFTSSQVIEPDQSEFTSEVTQHVSQLNVEPSPGPIEPNGGEFVSQAEAEEEEQEDLVAPIPMSRGKAAELSEEEAADLQFKKLGLSKNWWDSKRNESETQKEGGQPVDKFRTIKQNIKRGNTRSLLARFENMTKLSE